MAYEQQTASYGQNIEIDPVSRVAGALAVHAALDGAGGVSDAVAMASTFRGYEVLLKERDVRDAIFISSRACGACGGAHAICSALALEMTFESRPPQYAVAVRNTLAAVENLIDHPSHLLFRAGPDYSEAAVRATNPELWTKAEQTLAAGVSTHGLRRISDIMTGMNRLTGELYREGLVFTRTAREAYVVLGGKYPHPQTIVPSGLSATVDASALNLALLRVTRFLDYCRKLAAIWDDLVAFFYSANPRYAEVGAGPANFVDLGLWDDPDYYDAQHETAPSWGEARWSTPGAIVNGQLQTTNIHAVDANIEEFVDHAFYEDWTSGSTLLTTDPSNNPLSARHPWNKRTVPQAATADPRGKYTWSTAPRWRGTAMETGPGARLWLTALANKLPNRGFVDPTGSGLLFALPQSALPQGEMQWSVPGQWNALERNRARAYGLVQSTLAAYENLLIAFDLARIGGPEAKIFAHYKIPRDHVIGAGYWGGPRGYVSHHVEVNNRVIQNYQIVAPTSFNIGRAGGSRAPLEQAVVATPSLSSQGHERHIDIMRAIRSFDPCMSCASH